MEGLDGEVVVAVAKAVNEDVAVAPVLLPHLASQLDVAARVILESPSGSH